MDTRQTLTPTQLTKNLLKSVRKGHKAGKANKQRVAATFAIPVDTTILNEWFDTCLAIAKEIHPHLRISIFASYWIGGVDKPKRLG